MSQTKFPFDRQFQIGILSLMIQRFDFLQTATELIRPEYFDDDVLVWFFQTMRDYVLDYQTSPTVMVVRTEMIKATKSKRIKDKDIPRYTQVFKELGSFVDEEQYVINQLIQFCRRQEVRRTMLAMAPKADSDDENVWDEITDKMRTACSVGSSYLDVGAQYFPEHAERVERRARGDDRIIVPTGITKLDYMLGGGLKSGQVGVWMASTGVGKSVVLPHCGKRAVIDGRKVVHYTFELSEVETGDRYDATWTDTNVVDLISRKDYVLSKLASHNRKFGNSLIIKEYPTGTASINTLRQHLNQLRSQGFVPDLLCVDYGDLMKPTTNYNDEYADLGAIFRDLRGLAGELKIPIWTATQVNRSGARSEVVDIDQIGDSWKKAQIADVVIGICATPQEVEANQVRLFGAKNRNGRAKFTLPICTAYERMCFYDATSTPQDIVGSSSSSQPPPPTPTPVSRRKGSRATT